MRALVITALLVLCGVAFASAESELSSIETVEPTFLESAADVEATVEGEAEGFPHVLSKKMEKTTVEPRYYGENSQKLKRYVTPEYAAPKVVDPRKARKHKHPRVFTSHYFSPLPKVVKGKKVKALKDKKGRKYIPFRATVPTPLGERMKKKGFTEAELRWGRLPNKFDNPKDRMKNTMAPAPTPSLVELEAEEAVEVDTTEEMEAEEGDNAVAPPPFSAAEGELPTMINSAEEFYQSGWSAPTWTDEEASIEETDAAAEQENESYEDMEAEVALLEAASEEEESEDEEADEAEEESEETDEAEEESDEADESEEEADEESDSEDSEESDEELSEVSLIEEADESEEEIEDEMAVNEAAVTQVDMDADSDEAGILTEEDSAEASEEADEADEEANEAAVEATEQEDESLLDSTDALLVEVDAHLADEDAAVAEAEEVADSEEEVDAEAEAEAEKGTPGSAIGAGMTWEEAQNARLDAIETQIAAEKASAPKVAAKVVSSTADLAKTSANEQEPEYESEPNSATVETTAPELVDSVPSAQQILLEKIAKLKAIRRN